MKGLFGTRRRGDSTTELTSGSPAKEEDVKLGDGKGSLLFRKGWGKFKPFWFELSGETLLQFARRGHTAPKLIINLKGAILKPADGIVGEPHTFALFCPGKDPYYFKAMNDEQRVSWMSWLAKQCSSTEWSTSSMVTAFLDPVVVASQVGVIIEVNEPFLKFFGYERGEVVGKNVKMLMAPEVAQHHDSFIKSYVTTGIAKVVGKPRSLVGRHANGSELHLVLSLGVESAPDKSKTFIATIRPDRNEKKDALSRAELDTVLTKTVETTMADATLKIKESLSGELDAVWKRLEEYQAQYKLLSAKQMRDSTSRLADDTSDQDSEAPQTQRGDVGGIRIDPSNIVVGPQIGKGGSGCAVYACNVDGWECAMKELRIANAKQSAIDSFMAEIFLLESLPAHKNLVRFLFHNKNHDRIRIFMRRYETTLDVHLKKLAAEDGFLEVGVVAALALDVVRALEILHDYKIIHRDVKSQNLFVNRDAAGNVSHLTLSDFDSAKVVEGDAARTIIGTVGWMPPEVAASNGTSYSFSADVWSFGMVLFELMDLGRPFADIDEFERPSHIGQGNLPKFRQPGMVEKRFSGLLPVWKQCCALDPTARPSLRDIKVQLSHFL